MSEDITKIYEEYTELVLFCRYHIAEKLNHRAEMGHCGENILIKTLKERFQMLEFVTGFVAVDGIQSPQCDIIVCRKNFYRRDLEGGLCIVDPQDCIMIIEVKGNATVEDLQGTIEKNTFFRNREKTAHIKLALFAYKTRIGKNRIYNEFGYKYDRQTKSYIQHKLTCELALDYFICLHRDSVDSLDRGKQLFFLRDGIEPNQYTLDNNYPVIQNFMRLLQSLQPQI